MKVIFFNPGSKTLTLAAETDREASILKEMERNPNLIFVETTAEALDGTFECLVKTRGDASETEGLAKALYGAIRVPGMRPWEVLDVDEKRECARRAQDLRALIKSWLRER